MTCSIATFAFAIRRIHLSSRRSTQPFTGDQLPVYRDITLETHVLTRELYISWTDSQHKLGLKLDNVFADDQAHSSMLVKDAEIVIGSKRGIWDKRRRCNGTANARLNIRHTAGLRIAVCSLPTLATAPEMAGTYSPKMNPVCCGRRHGRFTPSSARSMQRRKTGAGTGSSRYLSRVLTMTSRISVCGAPTAMPPKLL